KLPSALIGKPVPETNLPPIKDLAINGKPVPGLTTDALKGNVTLVNVWASWCVPCRDEAPLLEQLAKDTRFKMVGINYKDATDDARRFLNRFGNPFSAVGADEKGRTSIDWGVYGVPETFLIDRDGRIAYKLVGPITAQNIDGVLKPQIEKALQQP
ncbi:MAG: DsbE family thiol:disulfide interchange protein, partial [Pseudolabrys sp.]|nr:DsbE family thiol:disulfide interchange protein [Pseudolabrys sp.]